ncbi:phosphotransferase [Paenibacillus alkalitolerans]|uniref:phosphotransferase n=1 Tax=Paenibacillus alkalitolerans TaxID=2799335 RepID=UPI0018F53148|nr:phosphotransferase [Paenibacillus alkalitolerans]
MKSDAVAIDQLLSSYFEPGSQWNVTTGSSGVNNTTLYVEVEGNKYVLRIYETHKDESKVMIEHTVLAELSKYTALPFQVPQPVSTRSGQTVVRLNDGSDKIASLMRYIPGVNPVFDRPETVYSFGQSAGSLLVALNNVRIEQPFIYQPYYKIEQTHPNCPMHKVIEWCEHAPKPFQDVSRELRWIGDQLKKFNHFGPRLTALPHQIIHGDLNESNVLAGSDHRISAILDFEFVTRDLRVMEAAVCISDMMVKEPNDSVFWDKLKLFMDGFASAVTLSDPEIEALPVLVQLRRLDVFVHFLGRYFDGIDEAEFLKKHISDTAASRYGPQLEERKLTSLIN